MQSPQAIEAFAEVGKAVLVSQNLEKLLIELLEFRKLHQDFDYATSTNGEMTPEMYKLNLTNGGNSPTSTVLVPAAAGRHHRLMECVPPA